MSRLPSLVAQARERTAPPPVPPLLDRSQFDSDEAHSEYMRTRRKAQERLREFNRLPRYRTSRVRLKPTAPTEATKRLANAAEMLRERERIIHFGCDVETGRKNRAPMSVWQPPPRGKCSRAVDKTRIHATDFDFGRKGPCCVGAAGRLGWCESFSSAACDHGSKQGTAA